MYQIFLNFGWALHTTDSVVGCEWEYCLIISLSLISSASRSHWSNKWIS